MAKRSVIAMMAMIVWVGLVRAEDAKEVIIGSAKELKGIKAKKIIWKRCFLIGMRGNFCHTTWINQV
ncbi:TPA: hypothetical protein EYN98_28790 [Candidatus Poribacteria bacterium]|jgi:hypothetical protein|nr:hypothetical protein [Candidatus Poribacteria bacterium]HIA69968.1 hypothetical protein [Candidatus Poribacteria bacterium]HIB99000.1 hypothetical protein [Candidatus Poribacteria bacterium]HIC17501.1 hypothetical protein [Candidatus Poribacteria bacterium]HIO05637.1 hypothetical protein [Candidatus Poribacteria bacterium]